MKKIMGLFLAAAAAVCMTACSSPAPRETEAPAAETEAPAAETEAPAAETEAPAAEKTDLMVAAAASLQYVMEDEIGPAFEKENPDISLTFTFDSSGKLQTQIEEGADADVFFSAAMKQMTALQEENLVDADSVTELLENKITLIVPKGSELGITGFEDITKAEKIAIGDPESVPAGQYANEAFENLGMWDDVLAKASLGTNVTEVLSWVAEGSADAGVVYLTDATTSDQADRIEIIGYAPEGSCKKVIYPVGIVSASQKKDAAAKFIEYLRTEEGSAAFEKYGFTPIAQ
ncbi:MAG: molybdate ABC transporter substrate-binding protein [Clostridium sp.]|nr:molybdate ABC transporter substrate-binding protein [Clostridium sp.]